MTKTWTEVRSKALLAAAGIPCPDSPSPIPVGGVSGPDSPSPIPVGGVSGPDSGGLHTPEQVVAAAARHHGPVVLKVSHPDLAHKSDVGGVVLGLEDPDEIRAAARDLLALREGATVLVEPQAPDGVVDLILGMRRDPVFGPVALLGIGGIFAEVLADVAVHVGLPTRGDVDAMVSRLAGRGLLTGARGRPAADLAAVAAALGALVRLAEERPEIAEIDVNPFRVYAQGGVVLDALVVEDLAPPPAPSEPSPSGDLYRDPALSVRPFFAPTSVAVVGASRTAERAGNIILKNLQTLGYAGRIHPVNPGGGIIEGFPACTGLADCPEPPELAVLAVPHHQVMPVLRDAAAAGVSHVIVVSGGFSDAGPEGAVREAEVLAFCRAHGIRLMGPNSIGTLDSRSGFCSAIGKLPVGAQTGVSVFGQSGTLSTGFTLEEITERGLGFSKVACMGNKADVDEGDFLDYLAQDPETRCVGLYIEGVKDGPRFRRALTRAAAAKPVVVLKAGRTAAGARAAASHTGSLAGSDRVFDAVFRQAGALRVPDFDALFGTLRALDMCPPPRGPRVGVVSLTGVGCVLAADACAAEGLEVAVLTDETCARLAEVAPEWAVITNPADIWSTIEQRGPEASFEEISRILLGDPNVDILLVISVLLEEGSFDPALAFGRLRREFPGSPILACHVGGRRDLLDQFRRGMEGVGIPVSRGPGEAIRTAALLRRRASTSR